MVNWTKRINAVKHLFYRGHRRADDEEQRCHYYAPTVKESRPIVVEPSKAYTDGGGGDGTGPTNDGKDGHAGRTRDTAGKYLKLLRMVTAERERLLARLTELNAGRRDLGVGAAETDGGNEEQTDAGIARGAVGGYVKLLRIVNEERERAMARLAKLGASETAGGGGYEVDAWRPAPIGVRGDDGLERPETELRAIRKRLRQSVVWQRELKDAFVERL